MLNLATFSKCWANIRGPLSRDFGLRRFGMGHYARDNPVYHVDRTLPAFQYRKESGSAEVGIDRNRRREYQDQA
jgi:hypothetical protein